ncbi:hypothetical protein Tco_1370654 [Tanacetum coccineum]
MSKRQRSTRGQPSSSYEIFIEEKVRRLGVFEDGVHQMHFDTLSRRCIHSGNVIDWEFLAHNNLEQEFFNFICTDPFSGPQWGNLFRINEPIYRELVREFFALFNFDASPSRCNPSHLGQAMENTTLGRLRNCNTIREDRLLMEFWPRIRNENSLIAIWVIMELHGGMCVWPIVMAEEEEDDEGDDEGDDGVGGDAGRGEAGGSADLYRNMSQASLFSLLNSGDHRRLSATSGHPITTTINTTITSSFSPFERHHLHLHHPVTSSTTTTAPSSSFPTTAAIPTMGALGFSTQKWVCVVSLAPKGCV